MNSMSSGSMQSYPSEPVSIQGNTESNQGSFSRYNNVNNGGNLNRTGSGSGSSNSIAMNRSSNPNRDMTGINAGSANGNTPRRDLNLE